LDPKIYATGLFQQPRSPYELMAGAVIAAALVTGINSDLPGERSQP
jgi:type IV secretory pathway VirB10-like protein